MIPELRIALAALDPTARDALRRVLIRDRAGRDEIAMQLLRYRDAVGDELADITGMLTMNPEARQRLVRLLGESDGRG